MNEKEMLEETLQKLNKVREKKYGTENNSCTLAEKDRINYEESALYHNACFLLRKLLTDTLIDITQKFIGKRIGEKTMETISTEIRNRLGVLGSIYRNKYMDPVGMICHFRTEGLVEASLNIRGQQYFDDTGRFIGLDSKFAASATDGFYIHDLDVYYETKNGQLKKVLEIQEALKNEISCYNRQSLNHMSFSGLPFRFNNIYESF